MPLPPPGAGLAPLQASGHGHLPPTEEEGSGSAFILRAIGVVLILGGLLFIGLSLLPSDPAPPAEPGLDDGGLPPAREPRSAPSAEIGEAVDASSDAGTASAAETAPAPAATPEALPTFEGSRPEPTPRPRVQPEPTRPPATPRPERVSGPVTLSVNHRPLASGVAGASEVLSVRVEGPSDTAVTLHSGSAGGPYRTTRLRRRGKGRWEGWIKFDAPSGGTLEYWIEARHPAASSPAGSGSRGSPHRVQVR